LNTSATAIQNIRVDHRRADIAVPQQLLYGPDIVSIFQQQRGERMVRVAGRIQGRVPDGVGAKK
jgi:hypothetical protein